ncbi:MAG: U32 family peptidase [Clostridiales bacterium]|nr:U32 family peptidase [Clostridiales bacterium]
MERQTCGILAPAGGEEQLLAAVRCGANAVYLGGQAFNARRNAANFDGDGLKKAVSYCHARNVRVYVTVNTIVLDGEMAELEAEAERIAAAGADAVIIQDMAVLRLFVGRYPSIERHASTQTAAHNIDGARFLQEAGFDSFVLARELTLSEMEAVCSAVSIKAEAFIHGAHCMSVSGACYLSAMLGGRSGNRGLCAQPCRLNWSCGGGEYALSLKDLSLISHIRELADAGVSSFKIEGRMKRPEYVAAATQACRLALEGKPYDAEQLRAVFSRGGFTDGYLTGRRGGDMFGHRTKEDVTGAEGVLKSLAALYRNETPLVPVDLAFTLRANEACLTASDGIRETTAQSAAPERAVNRPLDEAAARKNLEKTGGTPFFIRSFQANIEDGYTLPASALNALRRQALDALLDDRSQIAPVPPQPYAIAKPARYRSAREQPALWARFYDVGQIAAEDSFERILLPAARIDGPIIERFGDRLIAQLPTLLFPEDEAAFDARLAELAGLGLSAVWASNVYGVALGRRLGVDVHGGFALNIANTEALLEVQARGLKSVVVSPELSMAAIKSLGGSLPRGALSYGGMPLMHVRNCPVRAAVGCVGCGGRESLTDRKGIVFPVECDEKRTATLLNSVPLDLAGRNLAGLDFQLLYFTRERAEEVESVAQRFLSAQKTDAPHTTGLYYRELL